MEQIAEQFSVNRAFCWYSVLNPSSQERSTHADDLESLFRR